MELQYVTGNIRKFLVKIITNVVEMTALSLVLLSQLFKRVRMKRNFLDEIKYLVHRDNEEMSSSSHHPGAWLRQDCWIRY